MTARERNLAIAVAALLLGWAGYSAWTRYQDALEQRVSAVADAEKKRDFASAQQRVALRAMERLSGYQLQSLPADPQVAQQEYLAWLIDQLEAARLEFDGVTLTEKRSMGEAYTSLGYTAKATGDLSRVTRFLHAFYEAPMLHKLTLLKLTPEGGGRVRVNLNVQALVVSGADIDEGLPEGDSGRPRLADGDAYLASIEGRNPFRPYIPPPPPRPPAPPRKPIVRRPPPPPPPKFDDAAHAYFTGFVESNDRPQAWIKVRTTGETLYVGPGDPLKVGLVDGVVESVTSDQLIFTAGEDRFATPLGSNLRDGEKLAPPAVRQAE